MILRFIENSVPAEKTLYTLVNLVAIAFCLWLLSPVFRWIFPPFIRLTKCFFSKLFTWRILRRSLIGLAILATLIAIFYTEENWRGKRAWENCKREMEAKGAVLDWNAYIPPPVPDDQNFFKAPNMQKWFVKNLHATTNELMILMTNVEKTVVITNKADAANFLAWSDQFQPDFDLMRDALTRLYARMDGNYSQPLDVPIPHFVNMRSVAQVLAQRTKCYLLLGQPEKALHEITLLDDSRRLLEAAPTGKPMTLVAAMINVAITGLYVETVADGLRKNAWQEPQLVALQKQFKEINLLPVVLEAFEDEIAAHSFTMINTPPRELADQKLLWIGGSTNLFQRLKDPEFVFLSFAPRGWVYQNMVVHATTMQRDIQSYDPAGQLIFPSAAIEREKRIHSRNKWNPYSFLDTTFLPNLIKATQTLAYNQTLVNEAQIVCALERYHLAHGEYPETLEALVPQFIEKLPHDTIGGQPLHYRRTDNGKFLLYSVGWNEMDDGGQVALKKDGSEDREKGDWVWQYPMK